MYLTNLLLNLLKNIQIYYLVKIKKFKNENNNFFQIKKKKIDINSHIVFIFLQIT